MKRTVFMNRRRHIVAVLCSVHSPCLVWAATQRYSSPRVSWHQRPVWGHTCTWLLCQPVLLEAAFLLQDEI